MSRPRRLHPEAHAREVVERAAAAAEGVVPPTGWRYPYGYVLRLYRVAGGWDTFQASSYVEAVSKREELMLTGRYEKCWLEQRIE